MRVILVVLIMIFLISNCDEKIKVKKDVMIIPASEAENFKAYSFNDKGEIETIITGQRNVIFRDSKEIWLDKIRVLYISKENDETLYVELIADKGKVNSKTYNCEAWSNAVVIKKNDLRIESDRIFWDNESKKIYTKAEEKVVIFKRQHPDDPEDTSVIKSVGKNLVGDISLKNIEIDRTVTSPPQSVKDDI